MLGSAHHRGELATRADRAFIAWPLCRGVIHNRPLPKSRRLTCACSIPNPIAGGHQSPLQKAILETLADQRPSHIVLLNRRGFATTIQCPSCGHVVACPDCDLPLTHHRDGAKAVCHYCDYQIPTPPVCPSCKSMAFITAAWARNAWKLKFNSVSRKPRGRMDSDYHARDRVAMNAYSASFAVGTADFARYTNDR